MLKIFTTQLSGILRDIIEKEDIGLEDASRLLAQTIHSEGNIYIHGIKDCSSIHSMCDSDTDLLPNMKNLFENGQINEVTTLDSVIICTPNISDKETIMLLQQLRNQAGSIITLSNLSDSTEGVDAISDININLNVINPIVPLDDGTRIATPISIVVLYVYYCLYLTTVEILLEHQ